MAMALSNINLVKQLPSQIMQQRRIFCLTSKVPTDFALNGNFQIHVSSQQKYPVATALPIPANIDPSETTRFSPQRARDISATAILTHQSTPATIKVDITLDSTTTDPHIESYDCSGAVHLYSAMQSNVPSPFGGLHKFTHLNMPGGQWSQDSKFMSQNLQDSHYMNLRRRVRESWSNYDQTATCDKGIDLAIFKKLRCDAFMKSKTLTNFNQIREFSLNSEQNKLSKGKLTRKEQLKKHIKEYGSIIIVFHIVISLISLEIFYLLVSSGLDVMSLMDKLGLQSTALSNKVASGASTFVIAYAIHKVFAPLRIAITVSSAPSIAKFLRKKGFLKKN